VETVLLFDADGTLSPHDSEHLIWRQVPDDLMPLGLQQTPSKEAYGQLGSTYKDYLQTVLLHEEIFEDETFAAVCQQAAAAIRLYPDMLALLHRALNTPHTLPIILTGGSRLVWENVLKMVGLSGAVGVIGGGRHEDRAIMTPDVKGWLITLLQERCKANVWAFGSGEVDSIMLMKANQAVLITDSERWLTENVKPDWKDVLDLICPQLHDIILATNAPMALQYRPHEMRMLGRKLVREIFTRRLPTVFEE
jgi:phosphoglycolate phosphatase-like HAD superfamily hydrolase